MGTWGVSTEAEDGPPALEWLRRGSNSLIGNRFPSQSAALAFVKALHAAGARVVVPASAIRDDASGTWADALVVFLPTGGAERERAVWICAAELGRGLGPRDEFDPTDGVGAEAVFLWWD